MNFESLHPSARGIVAAVERRPEGFLDAPMWCAFWNGREKGERIAVERIVPGYRLSKTTEKGLTSMVLRSYVFAHKPDAVLSICPGWTTPADKSGKPIGPRREVLCIVYETRDGGLFRMWTVEGRRIVPYSLGWVEADASMDGRFYNLFAGTTP